MNRSYSPWIPAQCFAQNKHEFSFFLSSPNKQESNIINSTSDSMAISPKSEGGIEYSHTHVSLTGNYMVFDQGWSAYKFKPVVKTPYSLVSCKCINAIWEKKKISKYPKKNYLIINRPMMAYLSTTMSGLRITNNRK